MGWNLNRIISAVSTILGERFININIASDSNSSVEIVYMDELMLEEEDKITSLFPDWLRVQFIRRRK